MNLFKCFVIGSFLVLGACEKKQEAATTPTQQLRRDLASMDLLSITRTILKDLDSSQTFNLQTCPGFLSDIYKVAIELDPTIFNLNQVKKEWKDINQNLWLIRLKMNEQMKAFYTQVADKKDPQLKACTDSMRNAFRLSRYIEDYLGEMLSGEAQDFDQPEDFKPVIPTPFEKSAPWTMISPKRDKITLRSGDLIISRGNAYTSAAISRIVEVDSQFSHMAMIYVPDGPAKEYTIEEAFNGSKVLVLEAHIEIGSTIRSFKDYALDGNARNLLFRYDNPAVAHVAAKKTFDFLEDYRKKAHRRAGPLRFDLQDVNYSVPYDFAMDLKKSDQMFCTEIGYYGFNIEGVKIPTFMSDINPNLDLVKRLGIAGRQIFTPGDMELEPQFEMIAEFRNFRKLKGVRMKDMALASFLKWMSSDGYLIFPSPMSTVESVTGWLSRQLDLKFVKKRLPKNMNLKILNTVMTLDNVNEVLEKELVRMDREHKTANRGLLMTFPQGLKNLEEIRKADREKYMKGQKPLFHWEYRPGHLTPKPNPHIGG
jgi:hypothetical protein